MLEELNIKSIGGIEKAKLNFSEGFTVVTGESGAGKSSLVRGLELVCGKRSHSGLIRAGDEVASVEAFFYVPFNLPCLDSDLEPQDCSLSLKRELSKTGRGRCMIQRQTVPLNTLSETAACLMSIQSQFAQLELLNPQRQLDILDACGGNELSEVKQRLETLFYQIIDDEKTLRKAKLRESQILSEYKDFEEISGILENLSLTPDSEESLNSNYEETEHELKRLKSLKGYVRVLCGDEGGGLISDLGNVLNNVEGLLSDDEKNEIKDTYSGVISKLELLVRKLSELATTEVIGDLEDSLDDLETSIGQTRKCKRLAGVSTLSELMEWWKKGQEEVAWLQAFSKLQTELKDKIAQAKRDIASKARTLRALRYSCADSLQKRVSANLADLAMENADFRINIVESNRLRAYGTETCEFVLVRAGNEIPVAKAASGGELSRILLAIQASLPDEMLPPTLVFDEVEAGLGGRAAYLAGLKLKSIADRAQVILITHEASIAAMASCHYRVERIENLTTVTLISGEERVEEIARMLSGNKDDAEARAHAKKLLNG